MKKTNKKVFFSLIQQSLALINGVLNGLFCPSVNPEVRRWRWAGGQMPGKTPWGVGCPRKLPVRGLRHEASPIGPTAGSLEGSDPCQEAVE